MGSGSVLGYFLQALPIACLAGLLCLTIRVFVLKKRKAPFTWPTELLRAIFVCYLTGLFSLVILPANFWLRFYDALFFGWYSEMGRVFQFGEVNLVPSVIKCLTGELSLGSWVKTMLIGNIAMFVPFGFFLPFVTKIKSFAKIVPVAVAVPHCFEVLQLFFGRSLDVDDLICIFIGIIAGAAVALIITGLRSAAGKGR